MNIIHDDGQLVFNLWGRDVPFLMGEQISPDPLLDSATLIQSLAQSKKARVRMALIPLFLRHPEFHGEALEKATQSESVAVMGSQNALEKSGAGLKVVKVL